MFATTTAAAIVAAAATAPNARCKIPRRI